MELKKPTTFEEQIELLKKKQSFLNQILRCLKKYNKCNCCNISIQSIKEREIYGKIYIR